MSQHPQPTIRQLVAQIAEALGETKPQPLEQIRRIIKVIGVDFALELLRETQAWKRRAGYSWNASSGGVRRAGSSSTWRGIG